MAALKQGLKQGKKHSMKVHEMQRVALPGLHRIGAVGLVLVFSLSLQLRAQSTPTPAENWQKYEYASEGFSATYPSLPSLAKQSVPSAAGNFELRSYTATSGSVALYAAVCDYGSVVAGKDPSVLLQGAKNGALENSKSHLMREQNITLGVYPGLEFEAASDQAQFTARLYMVGTTFYITLVTSPLNAPYAGTTRFLNSFQIITRTH